MPSKRKTKLWGKVERIDTSKTSKFGAKKYHVKLVGVEQLIWVLSKDLSPDCATSADAGRSLPKNAKAYVNRGYVEKQRAFLSQNTHESNAKAQDDPVKAEARCAKWCVRVDHFVKGINAVLRAPVNRRKQALADMVHKCELPNSVVEKIPLSRFLDGELVAMTGGKIMIPTEGKPGYMTCSACESTYHFVKGERVLRHVISAGHQKKCHRHLEIQSFP